MIKVKVIADSIYDGVRLTTLECEYPRFIHGQVMTHRMLSRNASSSRAQPTKGLNQKIKERTAQPMLWTSNKPGMQGGDELTGWRLKYAKLSWFLASKFATFFSKQLAFAGLHKQYSNRVTEPYQNIRVLISATDWQNFFDLRCDDEAQPEIEALARNIRTALNISIPKVLDKGDWHLPYITKADLDKDCPITRMIIKSAARSCRVSYGTFSSDRELPTYSQDLRTFKRLVEGEHLHASPMEHVAQAGIGSGNFQGWHQLRHMIGDGFLENDLVESAPTHSTVAGGDNDSPKLDKTND